MSNPFEIEPGPHFPAADIPQANAEIGIFNAVMKAEINLFTRAWNGWPADDTAPQAGRSDDTIQTLLDNGLKYAFGDLYGGHR